MSIFADLLSSVFERRFKFILSKEKDDRSLEELCTELVSSSGEISGQAYGQRILAGFKQLSDEEKLNFFHHLAGAMNIDPSEVRKTLSAYEEAPSKVSYGAFMRAAEPNRQELIRRLNWLPGATEELVRMRADLLRLGPKDPQLQALDLDFQHLFQSWFNRGFLVLRPINWESPAHILEKITEYEAVHAIDSWDALRQRLEPEDRRCFAFFHPSMPDEPLIFVEVALTNGTPDSIQSLLAEDRISISADEANTAVFYSISNCQPGLASVSFGNSLIKQVVADLSAELASLKTFVTLSPIPRLASWIKETASSATVDYQETSNINALAAHYLLQVKRPDGTPHDPVARFHLGNGALVHMVHAEADTSPKGQSQSLSAMVNYLYDLDRVAQNHEAFATKGQVIASPEVVTLAKNAEKQQYSGKAA
ncbi:malonyl-CoA decarboxylase [Pseudovibrio sp. Tun.PSC04-5.I4]|uniref:malonyl-CoA decarboxylase domain-containing protein n=1 Tax=Pseudovibrio sp. Tun.PSC04-5.I4 TaxID=1798213 RepID=UPI000891D859|nr:malonyl-CoA decarboxylase [Pseudovibrio sp. Tun.PSC04-5.I4]SDQ22043.1 malonyl-CoA decarboxylase [Pseudovibrio sp. Tun.PSC04-5.I4]